MSCERVVFIIGVEHSGTTILYRMLARHPETAWFSQYSLRGGETPGRMCMPLYKAANRIGRRFFKPTWEKRFGIAEKIIPTPTEPHKVWDHILPAGNTLFLTEDDYREDQAALIRHVCGLECMHWGKGCLIVKLPRLSRAVRLLAHVLPDALFIRIVRDGRAVALSNTHKFARNGESREEALRKSALYWKSVVEYVDGAQEEYADRFVALKYRSLCRDVRGYISRLSEFAGLSHDASFIQGLPEQLVSTNERWFEGLPTAEKKLLNEILKPTLKKKGYAPFDI